MPADCIRLGHEVGARQWFFPSWDVLELPRCFAFPWQVLAAYLDYMVELGMLLGGARTSTEEQMRQILELETQLANLTVPQEERRDDEKIYHKLSIAKLQVEPAWIRAGRGVLGRKGVGRCAWIIIRGFGHASSAY